MLLNTRRCQVAEPCHDLLHGRRRIGKLVGEVLKSNKRCGCDGRRRRGGGGGGCSSSCIRRNGLQHRQLLQSRCTCQQTVVIGKRGRMPVRRFQRQPRKSRCVEIGTRVWSKGEHGR